MSTRSKIGILNEDGTVTAVYCHFDGYPEGVGKTLLEHYTSTESVRELLALGDLSDLGSALGEKHDFNDRSEDVCTFYGRDRDETGTEARTFENLEDYVTKAEDSMAEYLYYFDPALFYSEPWFVFDAFGDKSWRQLDNVLKEAAD